MDFLLYRLNAVFNVSETRAAVVATLCLIGGIVLVLTPNLAIFGAALLGYSFIYGCIWLYKFSRDQKTAHQSDDLYAEYRQQMRRTSSTKSRATALRRSRGTAARSTAPRQDLFVPPPVDRSSRS
jgi:Na+(H+)/acetate symporter ActP